MSRGDLTEAEWRILKDLLPIGAVNRGRGRPPEENRAISEAILAGRGSDAQNSAIAINLAPLLVMGGRVDDFKQGAELVLATLASGKTLERVSRLAALSHSEEQPTA